MVSVVVLCCCGARSSHEGQTGVNAWRCSGRSAAQAHHTGAVACLALARDPAGYPSTAMARAFTAIIC